MEVNQETRKCTKCFETHPIEHFNWLNKSEGRREKHCKHCTREKSAKYRRAKGQKKRKTTSDLHWSDRSSFEKRWGISPEDRENLIKLYSGGSCKCGNPACGSTEDLVLDHDHETNEIRGVLCNKCNRSLGGLGDTLEGVRGILGYLTKHYLEGGRGFTVTVSKKVHQ